jgi:hypothetical protein
LTPEGQRASLHLANLLSLVLFIGFVLNYANQELPRTNITQLDPSALSYCEISMCPAIQGLVITNGDTAVGDLETLENGELLVLEFTNTLMLEGEREFWLKVETKDGRLLEMASTEIVLDLKTRTTASFMLTSTKEEILAGTLMLGY